MLRRTVNFLRGSVRLRVQGAFPERFVNLCAQERLEFWALEWEDAHTLCLTLTRQGAKRAAPLAEKLGYTLSAVARAGVPQFLGRFRHRYALLVGLALALGAVGVLSRFVLTLDVQGNEQVSTAEILTVLQREGLRPGVYGPGLDEKELVNRALMQLPKLSWMSINRYGIRAEVLVREAVPPPELEQDTIPGHVIAEAGGIITRMEVLEGEAACTEGDTVIPGQVLIAGDYHLDSPEYSDGIDLGRRQVTAAGQVWARTWRTLKAQLPLQAQVKTEFGEEVHRWNLIFLGRRVNFPGKSGISTGQCDKISRTWILRLPSGQALPIALQRETLRPYGTAPVEIHRDAAEALLRDRLEAALREELGDGEVVSCTYTARVEGGMLLGELRAECREEIGRFVPLTDLPQPADPPSIY